jgi:deoxyribodipyrimidine photo-lyase
VPGSPLSISPSNINAGEAQAQERLEAFIDSDIEHYAESRNRMDLNGTSGLSPYLRFGMLSARQATWAAREADARAKDAVARQGTETWLNELIWCEFYAAILYQFPYVLRSAFRTDLCSIHWREDPAGFAA